jgi:hypothetical protein
MLKSRKFLATFYNFYHDDVQDNFVRVDFITRQNEKSRLCCRHD